MRCSCGLPHRMLCPCPHVLSVVGNVHASMCHIRWHTVFQRHFDRNTEITQQLLKILSVDWDGVDVSEALTLGVREKDPRLTDAILSRMKALQKVAEEGGSVLVGETISLLKDDNSHCDFPIGNDCSPFSQSIDGLECSVHHSPAARRLLTQEHHQEAVDQLDTQEAADYCSMKKTFDSLHQMVEHDSPMKAQVHDALQSLHQNVATVMRRRPSSSSLQSDVGTLDFGCVVLDKSRVSKRGKHSYER